MGLAALGLLAACGEREPRPTPSAAAIKRQATAADYAWFDGVTDLDKGYCFVWVAGLKPQQVLDRLKGKELERVAWQQLVGAGDGQRVSGGKYFFGVARLDATSLIIEDNGNLGLADQLLSELSVGTTVVCNYHGPQARSRFLVMSDRVVELEFDPASDGKRLGTRATELASTIGAVGFTPATTQAASFALAERLTGVPLTLDLLKERTYLFSSAPR
ncbi:DUF6461 domain-containing protein [Paractinoplanes atraurantiacus]|uniref:Uncharacterized protein n=1 Tax=Paractinoplanes atraurantiacus TaxID=1036182 RepID=A0A285KX32_9ACTN|nr:DUF6461 domain-containing protein [Actinoplanes atraurantiacus]SNY75916.1 hypothetical protein SAMN05421748_16112 [Actinoplanes atraurantiacus]